jgi:putative SOS response-associated peptidase YedK
MCGRIALYTPPRALARLLAAAMAAGLDTESQASWNVAPTDTLFGVRATNEGRELGAYGWGLVPYWSKDRSSANKLFNARAETVDTKPSFRWAFERHRLLVPVDGFYEWDRAAATKSPHFFQRADGTHLVLAGLYERWRDPSAPDAPALVTCSVLTTTPGPDMDDLHNRMPVVLEPDTFDLWLTAAEDELDAVHALCHPAPAGTLVHHLVDAKVGNVNNNGPELVEPVQAS